MKSVRIFGVAIAMIAVLCLAPTGCDNREERPARRTANTSEVKKEEKVPTRPDVADPADWCAGHAVPESMCTKCHPKLVEGFKESGDWCAEHGYPESVCPKCNPMKPPKESAKHGHEEHGHEEHGHEEHDHGEAGHGDGERVGDLADWCAGHAVPESMCSKCHPKLIEGFKKSGDWCAEHGYPESVCPRCNPMKPPKESASMPFEQGAVIRLKKKGHEELAGFATAELRRASLSQGVQAPARVVFDRNRLAAVRAPVPGIVRKVLVDLGQRVKAGEAMFVLASVEVGDLQGQLRSARAELKTAEANLKRQRTLRADKIAATRQVELASQEVAAARSRLDSLRSALKIAGSSAGAGRYTVRAPREGAVVEREAVVGAAADRSTPLATVVDTTHMWAFVDVAERDVSGLRKGQSVRLAVDGVDSLVALGEVTWISPRVDPRTRTVRVRAEFENASGQLRANQFARATFATSGSGYVLVPRRAVQRIKGYAVVFVRKQEGLFEPRVIETGSRSGEFVQARSGVKAGERVVVTGAFLLKTELMRDSIGAGCCEVE